MCGRWITSSSLGIKQCLGWWCKCQSPRALLALKESLVMATMQLNIVLASGQWTLRSWELYLVDCHPVGSRNIAWENNHRSDGRLHTLPAEPTPVQTWLSLRLWLPLVPRDTYCLSDFSVLSYAFRHFHAIVSAMAVPRAHVWKWFESILRFSIVLFSVMDKSLV